MRCGGERPIAAAGKLPMHLIALGANLPSPIGSPLATLQAALAALDVRGLAVSAHSEWYRTPAFPAGSGPDYVNGAAVLGSPLDPHAVLAALHAVEQELGRQRSQRWGPRVCDLDLIASGDAVLPDAATARAWIGRDGARQMEVPPGLILPHPRLQERAFVLRPLADVAADWRHPLLGVSVREMLAALPPTATAGISRLDANP
jgi:2-amino-4-hydroxy-6-hydroxymethyldihydropteridine diphosphokinase